MEMKDIAKICHEANRLYCEATGDFSQPRWEDAPDWQIESAFDGVQMHLNNSPLPPSASHDAWLKFKKETGWKYGPIKDAEKKEHPCILPFDELPIKLQIKDSLFSKIVHALSPMFKRE